MNEIQRKHNVLKEKASIRARNKISKLYETELAKSEEAVLVFETLKKTTEINKFINELRSFMKQDIQKSNSTIAEYLENAIFHYIENEFLHNVFLKAPQDKEKLERYKLYTKLLHNKTLISSGDIKEMNVPQHIHDSMEFSLLSQRNAAEQNTKSNQNIKKYFQKQNELKAKKETSIAQFMEEVIPKR